MLAFRCGVADDAVMASSFVPYERDQLMLLPPSVAEWVPEGHQVRFVADAVELLDLSGFVDRHPLGGVGRRAYHPAMMVGLLLWAYSNGVFSSREIERRCETDLAFRFITANQCPDHATIARFRVTHEQDLKDLHRQVLVLCAELGLTSLGLVALDGTKVKANASKDANRTKRWLDDQIAEWFARATEADRVEDDTFGDRRGDEVPAEVVAPEDRVARMIAARDKLAAADRAPKRPRSKADPGRDPVANVTDPESALMPTRGGFIQGYNAQTIANPAGVVLWSQVVAATTDTALFVPSLTALRAELGAAGLPTQLGTVVADAGYWSEANATADIGAADRLIATDRSEAVTAAKADQGLPATTEPAVDLVARRDERAQVMHQWEANEIDYRDAAQLLGLSITRTYALRDRYRRLGPDGLMPARHPKGTGPRPKRPSSAQQAKHQMRVKLTTEAGKATYRRRAPTIEGVFANTKHNQGFRTFTRRGLAAADAEWSFVHVATNLAKIRRAIQNLTALMAGTITPAT